MRTLTIALEHARSGFPVFPLGCDSKKPLISKEQRGSGCHNATTDETQIRIWFVEHPRAKIGVAMSDGLVGIDVDAHKGANISDWSLPKTRTVRTPSGGYHLYFRYDGILPCRKENELAPGVCIKASGGYLVAPGSMINGKRYAWIDEQQPIAVLPERIAELIRGPDTPPPPDYRSSSNGHAPSGDIGSYWLARALEKTGDGVGDEIGYWLAQQLLIEEKHGALVDVCATLASYADQATLNPTNPFSERDVSRWISSAGRSRIVQIGTPAPRTHVDTSDDTDVSSPHSAIADSEEQEQDAREQPQEAKAERSAPQATLLVRLASAAQLFHDADRKTWAKLSVNEHAEVWPLHSQMFKQWLARRFYLAEEKTPSAQAFQHADGVLDGKALWDGPQMPVYTRLAGHDGSIYLDLADEQWQAVQIDATGWRIIAGGACPVRFRRAKGMHPLPVPTHNGSLDDLRAFVNLPDDNDVSWRLFIGYLLGALCPSGPFPLLGLHGQMGSAKTTLARVARRCFDPNAAPVRSEPKELRDLAIAANNAWAIVLDNLSSIPVWLSDALCRLSTGGGSAYRTLYENDDETIFDAQRPIILTGIEEVATRGDLLDRAILLSLPAISEEKRRPEKAFWRDFDAKHAGILGALLDAVSGALAALLDTHLEKLPRMADFALWVTAAEDALGWPKGSFVEAYTANRADANTLALESSPVAEKHLAFMEGKMRWSDTASALHKALTPKIDAEKGEMLPHGWPKTPRGLSGALTRLAPNLQVEGITITHSRAMDSKRTRIITLEKMKKNASGASGASNKNATSENMDGYDADVSDAPPDEPRLSDVSRTHRSDLLSPEIKSIWTHTDAPDVKSRALSNTHACPQCGGHELYHDERDGVCCYVCGVPMEVA